MRLLVIGGQHRRQTEGVIGCLAASLACDSWRHIAVDDGKRIGRGIEAAVVAADVVVLWTKCVRTQTFRDTRMWCREHGVPCVQIGAGGLSPATVRQVAGRAGVKLPAA